MWYNTLPAENRGKRSVMLVAVASALLIACNPSSPSPEKEKEAVAAAKAKKDSAMAWKPVLDTGAGKQTIYLTFDDGPNFGSSMVMNIAKEEQVPITFFTIGVHVHGSPVQEHLWKEMHRDKLFELCNHSYTHAFWNRYNTYYSNPDTVVKDFNRNRDSSRFTNNIIRTPGNNIWRMPKVQGNTKMANAAADALYKSGYLAMGWDAEWSYVGSTQKLRQSAEQLYSEVEGLLNSNKTKIPNHLVLLTHDLTFRDAEDSASLRSFVKLLKANPRYQFAFASQYPGL
jgi:peptidoglycan-N-acetylglucosamine deacetylase